ncbi:uncharacterized protein LOC113518059 [Galleria mellonella]|uniref:Uncharacterized protein LOC113518059 n=1 Tax=Galleria mellonella TaxID=7137 RepID=A0A6J1WZF5_GALME|nr:uncharacterized protein LOC113518059 [Galleria mellonella]
MFTKFTVLLASLALSSCVPIQIFSNGVAVSSGGVPLRQPIGPTVTPATYQPINQQVSPTITPIKSVINSPIYSTPSIAFGFGSGFSSDIAGIRHSTSIGSSFSTGDARAYGSGIGGTGETYASGIGVADASPSGSYLPPLQSSQQRYDSYGNPVPDYDNNYISNEQEQNTITYYPSQRNEWSQNYGNGYAPSDSAQNNEQFQAAVSATQNAGDLQSSTSLAQNQQGQGYQTAVSSTQNGNNFRSAISNAQSSDGYSNFGSATTATQNIGTLNASTAQAIQRNGGALQQSGATIISGPGIQAAQAHAINTGYYRY